MSAIFNWIAEQNQETASGSSCLKQAAKSPYSKKAMTTASDSSGPQLSRVEKRLLAIPLLYILLRMWGTLQFFFSLAVDHTNIGGCIPVLVQKIYFGFGVLQAIGDGGQGWGNAILYIFFSPDIRRRLFGEPFDRFLLAAENKFQELLETETMSKSVQSARVQGEQASLVGSENTITGGKPATGYGVKSYRDGSTTTGTSETASHSAAGYAVKSHGDAPTTTSTNSKAFSQSVNINQRHNVEQELPLPYCNGTSGKGHRKTSLSHHQKTLRRQPPI